jgi:phenylalanyl-tRNA synthetase beta chain
VKISVEWLRELVDTELDADQLARLLTMGGFEVEGRTSFAPLAGVVVAEVRGKMPHPDAAKLTLVDVFTPSQGVTRVVCGAPNVPEPGRLVFWAPPGARLPGGITIAAKEVRGVLSPGMLCSEDELGFGASHAGIIVLDAADGFAPGDDVAQTLGLPDEIFEVNVGPNRPDCLGHVGIAREVAALGGGTLRARLTSEVTASSAEAARVEIVDAEGCPRYTAIVLEGVRVAPSPLPLRLRLQSLGVRAISNVVDATNLELLESGQPLHAFDLDKLAGHAIVVRRARVGESIVTLDGATRPLGPEDLAICDSERPVAVAGVMGGAETEVSPLTTRVLLESAYFEPARVRRTGRRLGLHTEASHRFERGVDPNGVADASRRCAMLIQEVAGGHVSGSFVDRYPRAIEPARLSLRPTRTDALLGARIAADEQAGLLGRLGLAVDASGDRIQVTVPTFRPDLTREADLIEEIARLYGYDRFPTTIPRLAAAPAVSDVARHRVDDEAARDALRGLGLDEIVTYGFVAPERLAALDELRPLQLANPLRAAEAAMRTTLVPGLVGALERNLARGVADVRLFELGPVFLARADGLADEPRHVAGLLAGRRDGWLSPGAPLDFYDVKGVVEELCAALGHVAAFARPPAPSPALHPGVQARVSVGERAVGVVGQLHPEVGRRLSIEVPAFVFELDLEALGPAAPAIAVELPRFPAVQRDLSFFIAEAVEAQTIARAIDAHRDPRCVEVRCLEDNRRSEAAWVPEGQKGMLWSFTYRAPDRTLTDAEVQPLHTALVTALVETLAIAPR